MMRLKEKCEICCLAGFAEKYIFWVATGSDPLRSHQLYHLMEIFGEKYILWREREGNFWLNTIDSPQKFSVCFEVREGSENVDLISFLISPPWWSRQVGSWAQLTGAQLSGVQFAENPPWNHDDDESSYICATVSLANCEKCQDCHQVSPRGRNNFLSQNSHYQSSYY